MSTPPSPSLASAWLVVAVTDHESDQPLAVFLDEQLADGWRAELTAYHETRPSLDANASDMEFEAAYAKVVTWRDAHPAGAMAAGCMKFVVQQLPLHEPPTLLGWANAKELRHFQLGAAAGGRNDLVLAKDQASHWRSRERDGDPVPVYTR